MEIVRLMFYTLNSYYSEYSCIYCLMKSFISLQNSSTLKKMGNLKLLIPFMVGYTDIFQCRKGNLGSSRKRSSEANTQLTSYILNQHDQKKPDQNMTSLLFNVVSLLFSLIYCALWYYNLFVNNNCHSFSLQRASYFIPFYSAL